MRRFLIPAGSVVLLLGATTAAQAYDHPGRNSADSRNGRAVVVVDGLDNPRQLSWAGRTLLVAEAGSGGTCTTVSATSPATTPSTTPATTSTTSTTSTSTSTSSDGGT